MSEQRIPGHIRDEQVADDTRVRFDMIPNFYDVHGVVAEAAGRVWGILDPKQNKAYDEGANTEALICETTALLAQSWFLSPESAKKSLIGQANFNVALADFATSVVAPIEHEILPKLAGRKYRPGQINDNSLYIDMDLSRQQRAQAQSLTSAALAINSLATRGRVNATDFEFVSHKIGQPATIGGNRLTKNRRVVNHLDSKAAEFAAANASRSLILAALGSQALQEISKMKFSEGLSATVGLSLIIRGPNWRNPIEPSMRDFFRKQLHTSRALMDELVLTGSINDHLATTLFNDALDQSHALLKKSNLLSSTSSKVLESTVNSADAEVVLINGLLEMIPETPSLMLEMIQPPLPTTLEHGVGSSQPPEAPESTETATETPEEESVLQEAIAALLERNTALTNELESLREPYRCSHSQLKNTGLTSLSHAFQNGFVGKESGLTIDGVSKPASYRILATLQGLRNLALANPEVDALQKQLRAKITDEQRLTLLLQGIRVDLNEHGHNGFSALSNELGDDVSWLETNREALTELFDRRLTPDLAAELSSLLDSLFYTEPVNNQEEAQSTELTELPPDDEEPVSEETEGDINIDEITDEPIDILALPLKEQDVALQLDWEVFPPEVTLRHIQERVAGVYKDSDAANIEWGRIKDLLQISQAFEGTVYRAKPRALGTTEPYFVVEANIEGKQFVIAENPQYGNATYILRADRAYDDASWQEIFEQSREFARLLGAERIVHSDKRTHLERIMSNIQSQMLIKV